MSVIDNMLMAMLMLGAIGSGIIGGVFFAFSTFVMKALSRLPAPAGIAAMQSINIVVINPLFLGVFMGTALICAGGIVAAIVRWEQTSAAWMLAGAVLYLGGTFFITLRFNVPLNNALARAAADEPASAGVWDNYLFRWTAWNHVRTAAALAAAASFTWALRIWGAAR